GDLEDRAGLDLLHVLPVPTVPGRRIHRDVLLAEDRIHLTDVVLGDDLTQTDRAHLVAGDHDPHPALADPQHVEGLALAGDLRVLDTHHLANTLSGVHCFIARLEAGLHACSLLAKVYRPIELRTGHALPHFPLLGNAPA